MSSHTYRAHHTSLKQRGNPNWCRPAGDLVPDRGTSFGDLVEKLGLASLPELWECSRQLKAFAKKYRTIRYVPERLLHLWGMEDAEFYYYERERA